MAKDKWVRAVYAQLVATAASRPEIASWPQLLITVGPLPLEVDAEAVVEALLRRLASSS